MNLNARILETQQECINLQQQIKEFDEFNKNSGQPPSDHRDILAAKLRQLRVEVDVQKNVEFHPTMNHPLAVRAMLLQELDQAIEQSKKIFQVVTARCATLNKKTEQKENLILEQKQLHDALSKRLEELQSHRSSVPDEDAFVKRYDGELAAKRRSCERQRKELKKKLSAFVKQHFPYPTLKGSQVAFFEGMVPRETLLPLEQTVDDLISLAINKPESPYLTLGSQHYSQYIELLLSYGLASRHPSDINKVRLSEMHM